MTDTKNSQKRKPLEIKESCQTSEELLRSTHFRSFLERFKKEETDRINDSRGNPAKIESISSIRPEDYLYILSGDIDRVGQERVDMLVEQMDKMYDIFRSSEVYSRLTRLDNSVFQKGQSERVSKINAIIEKGRQLTTLIQDTRRRILEVTGKEGTIMRTSGTDPYPKLVAIEASGHKLKLPPKYSYLAGVPFLTMADVATGIHYDTDSNKREDPFYELDDSPIPNSEGFSPDDWVAIPFNVGGEFIMTYIKKEKGLIEMEPGALNLFPLMEPDEVLKRKPDGFFFFGTNPESTDLGYFHDDEDDVLIGSVPDKPKNRYFGYMKKPVLTMHNVRTIEKGGVPLHCGAIRYVVRFDESNNPFIDEAYVKADDMGHAYLQKGEDGHLRPYFSGTETGAFACLDGLSERAQRKFHGREIGYNKYAKGNSRQVVEVTRREEIQREDPIDILLYMNNYSPVAEGESTIDTSMSVEEAMNIMKQGARVASGSTGTDRGEIEKSYYANPFPMIRDEETGKVLHPRLADRFEENMAQFQASLKEMRKRDEVKVGVGKSQLMAGVYKENSDKDLLEAGWNDRDMIEKMGPQKLADNMIREILDSAIKKRNRLSQNQPGLDTVYITVVQVGDSRTGKSETNEAMADKLDL